MVDLPVPLLPHTAATGQAPCLTTSDSSLATCSTCWAAKTGARSTSRRLTPKNAGYLVCNMKGTGGKSRLCSHANISAARSRAT